MEDKNTSKKKLIIIGIIAVLACNIIGGIIINFFMGKSAFSKNEKLYFEMFANTYDEGEYEFYSLDAYYLLDTGLIFYNAKYKAYIELEDKWVDVDEVVYGRKDKFENKYCRSWDDLNGFEGIDKEFERTVKEGRHKEYTQEEIEELLEEAYKNKD